MGKPEGKRPLGGPKCTWVDNNNMDLEDIEWGMDELVWLRDKWRALVKVIMNLRVL
jgi:hypothetical protein